MKKLGMGMALLALFGVSQAQAEGFGVHGGFNFAEISSTPATSTDTHFGWVLGGHYDLDLAPFFVLEPGLQFAQRGYDFALAGVSFSATYSYLEIPVLVKAKIPAGPIVPVILAGPNFGLKLGSSCSVDNSPGASCTMNSVSSVNFGLDLGAGLEFPLVAGTAFFDVRYHLGLSDVDSSATTEIKHRGVMLVGGYHF